MILTTTVLNHMLISLILSNTVHAKACEDIESYENLSGLLKRITTVQKGNYTIQVVMSFTDFRRKCKKVTLGGMIRIFALNYAIDKFNNNSRYSNVAKIGLQLDDDCFYLPVTMSRGMELISYYRPNSICRTDFLKCNWQSHRKYQVPSAIVGTLHSSTTIPLAKLMSLYNIPIVSFAASSQHLSHKMYKTFFRTIPSDINQVAMIVEIIKKFKWNTIFAVGSDDEYGKFALSNLKKKAQEIDICIEGNEYISPQSNGLTRNVKDIVQKIKQNSRANVVILFCQIDKMGELILQEANNQNLKRIWLTSEAWSPHAVAHFRKKTHLLNVTHGLLSVSLKQWPIKDFIEYTRKKIQTEWNCNIWIMNYLRNRYGCRIKKLENDTFSGKYKNRSSCMVAITDIMDDMRYPTVSIGSIVDAITSLGISMYRVIENNCSQGKYLSGKCALPQLQTAFIVEQMFKVNYTNVHGEQISYTQNGDPQFPSYTLENLVYNSNNGKLEFLTVGEWRKGTFHLNNNVQWPYWFYNISSSKFPLSQCSKDCQPGEFIFEKMNCCWICKKCQGNYHTSQPMMTKCLPCGYDKHTLNNKECKKTPVFWIDFSTFIGKIIVVVSVIGLTVLATTSFILWKHKDMLALHEQSPHMNLIIYLLLLTTFVYGLTQIIEPTEIVCHFKESYVSTLLMMYSAYILSVTHAARQFLKYHSEKLLNKTTFQMQLLLLSVLFLIEMLLIVTLSFFDGSHVEKQKINNQIWKQCEIILTFTRLVHITLPFIILCVATITAFRERNDRHPFSEPKFLSFLSIGLCVIFIAFILTLKYVHGFDVVLTFGINICGYTLLACTILPRVYIIAKGNRPDINSFQVEVRGNYQSDKSVKRTSKTQKVAEEEYNSQQTKSETSTKEIPDSTNTSVKDCQGEVIFPPIESLKENDIDSCLATTDNSIAITDGKEDNIIYSSSLSLWGHQILLHWFPDCNKNSCATYNLENTNQ